jgi:membrane protease YdiL (CAAX protease family)
MGQPGGPASQAQPGVTGYVWLMLPAALMLSFAGALPLVLGAVYGGLGNVPPRVFLYLPFVSPLLPSALLWMAWMHSKRNGEGFAVSTPETRAADVGIGVAVGALCILVFVGSLALLRRMGQPAPDFSSLSLVHHVFFSTVGALVPGVAEEVYFRGFLSRRLEGLSPALVLLLTSASFASWHLLSPPYLLHTFVIGLVLGATYALRGRLLPCMVAHTLANMSAGILFVKGWV